MDVTALDGRGFARFMTAGTYFLRKYRRELNDLNVFPVPDGDTGTNMYLTARSAALEAGKLRDRPLAAVAAAAAHGGLMGARGNSGVILSQMLRGFAHHVRHRGEIDTFVLATGLREAVAAAKQALVKPVEGTIISVAEAAAEAAYSLALHEPDFFRLATGIVREANKALDRTTHQLPALEEAGVVDAGGAGFVYFLEGVLRFLPDGKARATAFPRRPPKAGIFTRHQEVGSHKFCTEFILEAARCTAGELREQLTPRGESVIVAGLEPTLKVHLHTDDPEAVQSLARRYGKVTRVKVDDMERQHRVLVVDAPSPAYSVVCAAPGPGFERIVRELGAEIVVPSAKNPSVRDFLRAINACFSETVFVLPNDSNALPAARDAAAMSERTVSIIPSSDIVAGIAALFALRSADAPTLDDATAAAGRPRSARAFFAGKDAAVGGTTVARGGPAVLADGKLYGGKSFAQAAQPALAALGAASGGLITLYYGGVQKERDAQRLRDELQSAFPTAEIEYYFGGQSSSEYWLSLE